MPDCSRIESLVTPFVDGELPPGEQQHLSSHLSGCAACRAKVDAERTVRALLVARRADLVADQAPTDLRSRCASLRSRQAPVVPFPARTAAPVARAVPLTRTWGSRVRPFALAASLAIIVGGAFLYQATRSSNRVLAAELAADHVKCFGLNRVLGTSHTGQAVEASMASTFNWEMQLPDTPADEGLALVGSRLCLYGEGKTAHIMFRHNGEPMSLFMLPRETRSEGLVDVFGHNCRIWSVGERTFVLVSREAAPEVERVAALVRASLK